MQDNYIKFKSAIDKLQCLEKKCNDAFKAAKIKNLKMMSNSTQHSAHIEVVEHDT